MLKILESTSLYRLDPASPVICICCQYVTHGREHHHIADMDEHTSKKNALFKKITNPETKTMTCFKMVLRFTFRIFSMTLL